MKSIVSCLLVIFCVSLLPAGGLLAGNVVDEITATLNANESIYESFLVYRDGEPAYEWYRPDSDSDELRALYSITKSINSLLVGIAVAEGYIESVHTPVLSYFPAREFANPSGKKDSLTIEHLLTMTCGFDWDEWTYDYSDPRNIYTAWENSDDRVQFVLDLPMDFTPGKYFNYNTAASHLVSAIIQESSGMTAEDFAGKYLFGPIGIESWIWSKDSSGYSKGGGLNIRSEDLARIGQLVLNEGKWDGRQIVPADWLALSLQQHTKRSYAVGFGYHWWIHTISNTKVYTAEGYNGQRLCIIPDRQVVMVSAGTSERAGTLDMKILEYILRNL